MMRGMYLVIRRQNTLLNAFTHDMINCLYYEQSQGEQKYFYIRMCQVSSISGKLPDKEYISRETTNPPI